MEGEIDSDGDMDGEDSVTFFSDPTTHIHELSMRLLPLRHIEQLLIAKLVPPDEDEATHLGLDVPVARRQDKSARNQEIFVRPGTAWKGFVARGKGRPANNRSPSPPSPTQSHSHHSNSHAHSHSHSNSYSQHYDYQNGGGNGNGNGEGWGGRDRSLSYEIDLQDEPTTVLHSVRHDIMALWRDPTVREVLRKKKIRLEEQPGLYVPFLLFLFSHFVFMLKL